MDRKGVTQDAAGYQGCACIMWRSWRIKGQASFDVAATGRPRRGRARSLAGTLVVDSEAEPMLLAALAAALHEPCRLRLGEEEERRDPLDIEIVGHEGNRIRFALH